MNTIPKDVPSKDILHVIPIDDLREHLTKRESCWCNPSIEIAPGGYLVIHNSLDGREEFETGRRKVS